MVTSPKKGRGLIDIWRDERGSGQELRLIEPIGFIVEQLGTTGRDHHGINHEWDAGVRLQAFQDCLDHLR